ncbi:esterase/lipase family protein [Streptacidiphilus neutrinimicus]|uniref:esterase/lipase family protein n=1 Tax=Streptacidiphilus neutrinimicus TaxID=105420 RepID=UPI0005A69894|nr:hypothetical protein [Streptacidiphilus neutrinimicus]
MSGPQDEKAEQSVGAFTLADPLSSTAPTPLPYPVPEPDEKWQLPNGFAHVFYGERNQGLMRPVIMADGFNLGRSDLQWLYAGLDRDYPLLSELRRRGRDVILLGFDERSASILDNAQAAMAAVQRTLAEQLGGAPLTVGGFSMGGIITRYALADLERQRMDHRTRLYFSYDSPHRGGVVPIGLQAFSHFIPLANDFARQMNSPAARQMLWRHYDPSNGGIGVAPERVAFLKKLEEIGSWPRIPRLIGLANGRGDGKGLDIKPGDTTLAVEKIYPGTTFYAQAQNGDVTVAELRRLLPPAQKTIKTNGFPELDAAPGGTLRSFGILADMLKKFGAEVDLRHEDVCFVPSVSAVSIRDIDQQKDLYADIDALDPGDSELDDFICSTANTAHTAVTEELCTWLLDRLPD